MKRLIQSARNAAGGLDNNVREVVMGGAVAMALRVSSAVLSFALSLVLARMLGAQGVGLYYLALSVATAVAIVGRFGLDHTLVRYVAAHSSIDEWGKVRGIYAVAMRIAFGASAACAVALFVLAPFVAEGVFEKPALAGPLRLMSLAVVPMAMFVLYGQLLRGLKRTGEDLLVRFVLVNLCTLVLLYLFVRHWGVEGAVCAYVAGGAVAALAGLYLWQRAMAARGPLEASFPRDRVIESALPLLAMELVGYAGTWAGVFVLGVLSTSAEAGVFAVAFKVAALSGFVQFSINNIAAPKFAAMHHAGDTEALAALARSSVRLLAACAVPVLLVMLAAPGWIMGLFGEEFRHGAIALCIMAAGQFVNVCTGPAGLLLLMSGRERAVRNNVFLSTALNVLTCVLLVPYYGAAGAAVALSAGIVVKNVLNLVCVKRHLGISLWPRLQGVRSGGA